MKDHDPDCPRCNKPEGACDIGDCDTAATHVLHHKSGYDSGPICTFHATDTAWQFVRKDCFLVRKDAPPVPFAELRRMAATLTTDFS